MLGLSMVADKRKTQFYQLLRIWLIIRSHPITFVAYVCKLHQV